MLAALPTGLLLAGTAITLWSGHCCLRPASRRHLTRHLMGWALGFTLILGAIGLDFGLQGMPDHAAMAYAAGLALLFGHLTGVALFAVSEGQTLASSLGRWMILGLPPFGAFAGLWLGLQAVQASLLLLPAWPSLLHAAAGLAGLAGGAWAWQGSRAMLETAPSASRRLTAWLRSLLIGLGVLASFLPWIWILPAQVAAAMATGELPMLLVALGLMLSPVMPGQASLIPFGLMAIAMALTSVLLMVLRLTRRPR